jgi:hypothetical protein
MHVLDPAGEADRVPGPERRLTLGAIAALVALAGRAYTGAILRTGATLKLRDA